MAKKVDLNSTGFVYSTNPNFAGFNDEQSSAAVNFLPKEQQQVKVRLETKHRGGKMVTLIENYNATEAEKIDLGKKVKTYCGTGGSVKDGEILVQGDQRTRVLQWLQKNGFTKAKIA